MWLHLDLDGVELHLRIEGYRKSNSEKWDSQWCTVYITLQSDDWLNYQLSSDILLACEVEALCNRISDLIEDKIQTVEKMEFIEPDLTFVLRPKKDLRKDPKYVYVAPGHEIVDIFADLHIHFWNGGLTANYLSLCFDRNDLQCLLTYLQCITHEISKDSKAVQELISKDIIRIY